MARVIGPNGRTNEVPDDIAQALVGNGKRGYRFAEPEAPKAPARTRVQRKTTK